jgi:hypothetical protein
LDKQLRGWGISDGGQLASVVPKSLAENIGADLLLYGTIHAFNEVPLGLYHRREVEVSLKLVEGSTEAVLWQSRRRVVLEETARGKTAVIEGIRQLGKALTERLKKTPLKEETEEAVNSLLAEIPSRLR